MISANEIEKRIMAGMPDAKVSVYDMTGGGDHYQVEVTSDAFKDKTPIKRHRMVYDTLRDVLGDGALHALALKTRTFAEANA